MREQARAPAIQRAWISTVWQDVPLNYLRWGDFSASREEARRFSRAESRSQ